MCCSHKIFHVFISPVKAVIHGLDDQSVNYILCTSDDHLEIGHRENVLALRFMDITDGMQWGAFQNEQAEEVCRFLRRAKAADDLFLCCDSGESRSAAIAAAVLLSQNQSDLYLWNSTEYHPNHYVFKLQCAALGVNIDDEGIFMRRKLNDDAFHRAILNNDTSGG